MDKWKISKLKLHNEFWTPAKCKCDKVKRPKKVVEGEVNASQPTFEETNSTPTEKAITNLWEAMATKLIQTPLASPSRPSVKPASKLWKDSDVTTKAVLSKDFKFSPLRLVTTSSSSSVWSSLNSVTFFRVAILWPEMLEQFEVFKKSNSSYFQFNLPRSLAS